MRGGVPGAHALGLLEGLWTLNGALQEEGSFQGSTATAGGATRGEARWKEVLWLLPSFPLSLPHSVPPTSQTPRNQPCGNAEQVE